MPKLFDPAPFLSQLVSRHNSADKYAR